MKRTSLNIDSTVFAEIRKIALAYGDSQTNIIRLFLNQGIARYRQQKRNAQANLKLTTCGDGWLQPGIDLRDRRSIWEALDEEELDHRRSTSAKSK